MKKVILNFEGEQHELTTNEAPEQGASELTGLLCVSVPKAELDKLEKARVDLYNFLENKLSEWQIMQVTNITGQIWKVANTKKWD